MRLFSCYSLLCICYLRLFLDFACACSSSSCCCCKKRTARKNEDKTKDCGNERELRMPRERDRVEKRVEEGEWQRESGDFSWGVLLYTEVAHTHTHSRTAGKRARARASGRAESQLRVRATAIPHSLVANAEFSGGRNQFFVLLLTNFFFYSFFYSFFQLLWLCFAVFVFCNISARLTVRRRIPLQCFVLAMICQIEPPPPPTTPRSVLDPPPLPPILVFNCEANRIQIEAMEARVECNFSFGRSLKSRRIPQLPPVPRPAPSHCPP